jgi:hypothetical protein
MNRRFVKAFGLGAPLALALTSSPAPAQAPVFGTAVALDSFPRVQIERPTMNLQLGPEFGRVMGGSGADPKLIVLVHGMTSAPNDIASEGLPEPDSGTLDYARFYFSYPFVRSLMGVRATGTLRTLSGVTLSAGNWEETIGPPDSKFKIRYRYGANENVPGDHILVPSSWDGTGCPPVAVFLTRRDGSRRLMPQTKALIDHVYDTYKEVFGTRLQPKLGQTPNMIFVGHSFGTLASRMMLTNPTGSVLGESLSADQRAKANAIRDKTICLVSLAGPHEGSPVANYVAAIQGLMKNIPQPIHDSVREHAGMPGMHGATLLAMVQRDLGQPAVQDLTTDRWRSLNTGTLRPELMVRTDNSLIPVYALIGHRPSGRLGKDPHEDFTAGAARMDEREKSRSWGLMFVDYLLHWVSRSANPKGWGSTSSGSQLDQMARYNKVAFGLFGISDPGNIPLVFGADLPVFYSSLHVTRQERNWFGQMSTVVVRTNRDGIVDGDGFVGVNSGYGWNLGTGTARYFANTQTWNVPVRGNIRGSWYRVIRTERVPWADANHETIMRIDGVGTWIKTNVVDSAGPVPAAGPTSVWP